MYNSKGPTSKGFNKSKPKVTKKEVNPFKKEKLKLVKKESK